jgi:hypothetical protein
VEAQAGTIVAVTKREAVMKRIISGFEIDWIGNDQIEVTRVTPPQHQYVFATSPDRKRLKRLIHRSPKDVPEGDPDSDAERYEEEARKAAEQYLCKWKISIDWMTRLFLFVTE